MLLTLGQCQCQCQWKWKKHLVYTTQMPVATFHQYANTAMQAKQRRGGTSSILTSQSSAAIQSRHGCQAADLQVTIDIKVVLLQKLLSPFCMGSSQLNVADADFSARSNRLQCCKDDLLLLEALHSIGGA